MRALVARIVSGGQTGVDRAALDVALELRIPCGGWCPLGRRAEDGPLDPRYPLVETPSGNYGQRTTWNVRDSDATLILAHRVPTGGTALTLEVAERLGRPALVVDPGEAGASAKAREWLKAAPVGVLNVAGPRESGRPGIYLEARAFLRELLDPQVPGP